MRSGGRLTERPYRISENPISKTQHRLLLADALFGVEGAVAGVEPVDFDGFAKFIQPLLVDAHLAGGAAAVVLALQHEDGRADVFGVGDGR